MGLGHSPSIVTSNLVMCLDAANYKSFKGVPATNILNQITYTSGNTNTALFKYTQGLESVNIPSLGYVNSKFVDIYNDYNGGSGNCCPSLFTFGTGATMVVSPSTTYTYSIIYKTTTGYSHPNYMYRYERNSVGTVLTEAGVHSTTNRTSLGDGWWFAWGQFTTQATTAYLDTYLFHYEYATQNRVYVYKAALYAGTYIIPPEHMLNSAEVRGATVATGGGWADLIGNGNHGTLTNGPTYNSSNGGSIVFDGTNDYIDISNSSIGNFGINDFTVSCWGKATTGSSGSRGIVSKYNPHSPSGTGWFIFFRDSGVTARITQDLVAPLEESNIITSPLTSNQWHHIVVTRSQKSFSLYIDGSLYQNNNTTNVIDCSSSGPLRIGSGYSSGYYYDGNASNVQIYNKALTATEVAQNFNALRGRYGV